MSSAISDEYGKRTLDFVDSVQKLHTFEEICDRVIEEVEWFGFTRVTVWTLPGPGKALEEGILLNNRPLDYIEHYDREGYASKDPVIVALRDNVAPFTWDDVRSRRLSKAELHIMDEGREFDARNGILIPIRTQSGSMALFSPCGREPILTDRARTAIEMIGIYSHYALQRVKTVNFKRKAREPLTVREREVMLWVASGKSDDEISDILNIGRETVTSHVENAKRKLDATRRTYAVVQAIRFGEIAL